MFGIGISELLLILLAIIILIRPEDLPKFMRTVGKLYGKVKHYYNEAVGFKDQVIKEIDEAAAWDEAETTAAPAADKEKPDLGKSVGITPKQPEETPTP